ncbi:MAG: MmgE/PrpD family protein [Acetobacteraceae bacterium]
MPFGPDEITARLAEYVVETGSAGLRDDVRREALRSFFNIIGCTLGGARHDIVELADRTLAPFAGPQQATLFGRGRKTDVLHATLINCLASSIYSFDDTHEQAVVHPSGPVASAVLALAEMRPVSGRDLLAAFALGVELECRLCKAVTIAPAKGSIAWSGTGISGGFGAAAAAGRLLGLDVDRMRHAMGIALAQASGIRVMHGSMMTSMMPAHAGQTGLRAAILAERGVTSSLVGLEGRYGFLTVFAEEADTDALAGGLGQRFEILRNTYKPYPCGIVIHPIIDACLQLRREKAIEAGRIASVAIQASPGAMALCNRRNPKDELQAHVSLHHWTAVAFIRGTARIQDMDTETAVRDPALMAFQDKVEATLNPALAADAAIVTVTMADGSTHVCEIEHGIGSATRPMTDAELERKFIDLAEPVVGAARTRELVAKTWGLGDLVDAGDLARACA